MNMMKFLIGATFTLLFVALFLAYDTMKKDAAKAPDQLVQRIATLEAQIADLKGKTAQFNKYQSQTAKGGPSLGAPKVGNPYNTGTPAGDQYQQQANIEQITKLQRENQKLQDQLRNQKVANELANTENEVIKKEIEPIIQKHNELSNREEKRATAIARATLMGTIVEMVKDEGHEFTVVKLLHPSVISEGRVLGVRRGRGIAARLKVDRLDENGNAFVSVLPMQSHLTQNPEMAIKVGDEVIKIPE